MRTSERWTMPHRMIPCEVIESESLVTNSFLQSDAIRLAHDGSVFGLRGRIEFSLLLDTT